VKRSGEEADVFGEHGDDALEDEAAGAGRSSPRRRGTLKLGTSLALPGDLDPVVTERGWKARGNRKLEGGMARGEISDGERSTGS